MPHPLSIEAQTEHLREAWRRYRAVTAFAQGDICRQKPGLRSLDISVALMFWRYLDIESEFDVALLNEAVETTMLSNLDCIVAVAQPEGGGLCWICHDSRMLELAEENP